MKNSKNFIAARCSNKEKNISIIICAMVILNLYGLYLQTVTGINSLVFTLMPFALLILLDLSKVKRFTVDRRIFIPCLISFSVCFLHICVNFNVAAIKCALYIVIFLLVSRISNACTWEYLKTGILVISVIMCVDALKNVPYLLSMGYNLYNVRLYTMLDKPYYSLVLTFSIVILLIDIAKHEIKHRVIGIVLATLFFFVNVFIMQAKASIICIITSVVFMVIFADYKMRRKIIIGASVIIVAIIVYYSINPDKIPAFLLSMIQQLLGTLNVDSRYGETYSVRADIYKFAWKLFSRNAIFGIGFGNYGLNYSIHGVSDFESSWLGILVEGGLIYTVSHVFILLHILIVLYRNIKKRDSQNIQMLILFVLYILFNIQNDYMNVMYWTILGIMYSTKCNKKKFELQKDRLIQT